MSRVVLLSGTMVPITFPRVPKSIDKKGVAASQVSRWLGFFCLDIEVASRVPRDIRATSSQILGAQANFNPLVPVRH